MEPRDVTLGVPAMTRVAGERAAVAWLSADSGAPATARPRCRRGRHPHIRHERRAPPDRAHVRQLPVERPRLGRRPGPRSARALAVRAAGIARRRPLDPGALGDLRDHGGDPSPLRHRPGSAGAARAGHHAGLPRRHDARAAARRGPTAATRTALRSDRRRPRARGVDRTRARCRRAVVSTTYGTDRGLLAGHDRARRRCSARRGASSPASTASTRVADDPRRKSRSGGIGEILVSGPTVAPASRDRDGWLHTGDLGSLDERGFLQSPDASPTRSSAAARTSPRPRSRRCSNPIPTCWRRRRPRAVRTRRWGEAVTAIVVARPGSRSRRPRRCARTAPRAWPAIRSPSRSDFTGTPLPRTRSGKLLRRELQ